MTLMQMQLFDFCFKAFSLGVISGNDPIFPCLNRSPLHPVRQAVPPKRPKERVTK
jgi:hypothetical protein